MDSEVIIVAPNQVVPPLSDPFWVGSPPLITPIGVSSPPSYADISCKKPADSSGSYDEYSFEQLSKKAGQKSRKEA